MTVTRRKTIRPSTREEEASLIGDIYDAGVDPTLWQGVISRIAHTLSADSALLFTPFADPSHKLWAGHHIDPAMLVAYADNFADKDLWSSRAVERGLKPGEAATSEMLATETELKRSSIWNEMLAPHDIFRMAGMFVDKGDETGVPLTSLVVYGSLTREPFDRNSLATLRRLAPHLRRSVRTNWLLSRRTQSHTAPLAILSAMPTAMIVCAKDARLIYANPAAETLLRTEDGVAVRQGKLVASLSAEQRAMERLVDLACGGSRARIGSAMTVSRRSPRRALTLVISPLPSNTPDTAHVTGRIGHIALVVVHQHDLALGSAASILQRSFGLSAAELRLADAMLRGGTLSQIAATLGVTHSTARTQLRSVFAKTSTNRQAELLKLIVRLQSAPADMQ